jgi:myosin I
VEGFCDKNKDMLFNDLIELTQCTSSTFIGSLFPEAANMGDKKRPTTAGFKIKVKLQTLQEKYEYD